MRYTMQELKKPSRKCKRDSLVSLSLSVQDECLAPSGRRMKILPIRSNCDLRPDSTCQRLPLVESRFLSSPSSHHERTAVSLDSKSSADYYRVLNESNFPHILESVINMAEASAVFHMAHVCRQWRRAVLDKFYHLKLDPAPGSGSGGAFKFRPHDGPPFIYGVEDSDAIRLTSRCRVLDLEDSVDRRGLCLEFPADIIMKRSDIFAFVHTIRLLICRKKKPPFPITHPRIIVSQGLRLCSAPISSPRRSKVVMLLEDCWHADCDDLLWQQVVRSLVLIFRPQDGAFKTIRPSKSAEDAILLTEIPCGLKHLIKILSAAHFSKVHVTVVNAESVYLPRGGPGSQQTVNDLLERAKSTMDFATKLRLTDPPFRFLTLEEYRSSIGEHDFAIETNPGYVSL